MSSQVSGSNELLSVDAGKVCFTIYGEVDSKKVAKQKLDKENDEKVGKDSSLIISCSQDFSFVCEGENGIHESGSVKLDVNPLFFEQTAYLLEIEGEPGVNIQFVHEDINIRKQIKKTGKKSNLHSGVINFYNNIGYSDLTIMVDGVVFLKIRIEVYPSKMSYRKDFEELRKDVAEEVYGLIFDYFNPTYMQYGISSSVKRNDFDFGIILSCIYKKIQFALDTILLHPHHILQKEYHVLPAFKVKKYDRKCQKWLLKHPNLLLPGTSKIVPEKMMAVKKAVTYNTKENRLTKHLLLGIIRRIHNFVRKAKNEQKENILLLTSVEKIAKDLSRYIQTSFLKDVEEEFNNNSLSLVFSMASGYRELYKCNLLLQHGLDITEQIMNVHLKQLSELYEYWCFIKLNALLRRKYNLVSSSSLVTNKENFVVKLIKGTQSKIEYVNPRNQEKFEMLYNKEYEATTVNQKPDNVLCLHKMTEDGTQVEYQYVFDAKYKIDDSYFKTDRFGNKIKTTPGPQDNDINTMHRYRDAILFKENKIDSIEYKREMFGAYILFPYDNLEEYKQHKYYQSISTVNIGGLPFLPNHTELVEKMLDELICESPFSAYERSILPRNIELELQKIDWNRDVLVAGQFDKTELDGILRKKEYMILQNRVKKPDLVKYIALYQAKTNFSEQSGVRFWGKVIKCGKKFFKRAKYYVFIIEEWKELPNRIKVSEKMGGGIRYASLFALKHSSTTSQLFAQTKELWRVLYELQYVFGLTFGEQQEKEFLCDNIKLVFIGDNVEIRDAETDEKIESISIKHFAHNTGIQLSKAIRTLKNKEVKNC